MSLAVLPELDGPPDGTLTLLRQLKDRFGDAVWLAVCPAYGGNDRFRLEQAAALADAAGLPLMAVNDVLYHAAGAPPAAGRGDGDPPQHSGGRGGLRAAARMPSVI